MAIEETAACDDEDHGAQAHAERAPIDVSATRQREPEAMDDGLVPGSPVRDAEKVADLAERHQETRARHEPEHDGFRNVAGEIAQLEDGDEDLDRPGSASQRSKNASALKTTSEIAFVGPLMRCDEDPKIEAIAVTTIAEYRPKRGSTPAMSAYAMACGSEIAATVTPASRSRRNAVLR